VGAKLVGLAFTFAARKKLKPNEQLLLLWMALTALDADNPPRYFAAREQSAIALGRIVPDEPDPANPRAAEIIAERQAAFQRIKIATTGLIDAGAIVRLNRGREGRRAEFKLTIGSTFGERER
jgi:hypothetical protein